MKTADVYLKLKGKADALNAQLEVVKSKILDIAAKRRVDPHETVVLEGETGDVVVSPVTNTRATEYAIQQLEKLPHEIFVKVVKVDTAQLQKAYELHLIPIDRDLLVTESIGTRVTTRVRK